MNTLRRWQLSLTVWTGNWTDRSSQVDEDLELLYDKVAGFYGALHEVLGPDGPIYCPWNSYEHIEQCLMLASCLIQSHVPQHFSMSFYSSIAEQIETGQCKINFLGVDVDDTY